MGRFRSKEMRRRLVEAAKRHVRLMSPEQARQARDQTGLIPLKHLPMLEQIAMMSHTDLVKVVLLCPFSDRFCWTATRF